MGPDRAVKLALDFGFAGLAGLEGAALASAASTPAASPAPFANKGAPHVALGRMILTASLTSALWLPRPALGRVWSGSTWPRTCLAAQSYRWDEQLWAWPEGYTKRQGDGLRVVAIDYGAKRNILRCLASAGCDVTVSARQCRHRRRCAGPEPRGGVPSRTGRAIRRRRGPMRCR